MQPVAVQIAYADWLEIEKTLAAAKTPVETDVSEFSGTIRLQEDPLAYQHRIRQEWP
jgi:hypothetical protein